MEEVSIVHKLIPVSHSEYWTKELSGVPCMPAHTWQYCRAISESSDWETYLYAGADSDGKIYCPIQIRIKEEGYKDIVSPYGFDGIVSTIPVKKQQQAMNEWNSFWSDNGFVTAYIMQHPLLKLNTDIWGEYVFEHSSYIYLIDLSLSIEELWQNMCSTHRYEIRRMEKDKRIELTADKEELITDFITLYYQTMDRVGASKIYHFTKNTLKHLILSNNSLLIGVKNGARTEAVSLFIFTDMCAEYFLNASSKDGRKYSRLIIWNAINKFKKIGVPYINLGGGIKSNDSLDLFKRRFGGIQTKAQVVRQIFNKDKYNYLISKHAKKNCETDYFPPYWANW